MPHDAGHLYALQAEGTPYVKIGYVVSTIEQRRRFLRSQNPFRRLLDLTTIATVRLEQDLAQVEHQLHRLLAAHRYQGEWYTLPLTAEAFRALVQQAQEALQTFRTRPRPPKRRGNVATVARPRLATETYTNLTARVPKALMGQLEQYLAHLRSVHPGYGIDRSAAVRVLLFNALDQAGFPVPREAGPSSGPVLATADQTADHGPVLPDQSATPTAQRQDRKRTTRSTRAAVQE